MPNFKLVFATETVEKSGDKKIVREGQGFERIISAPDGQIAKKIAEAMLGEEVFPILYLGRVLSVQRTKLKSGLSTFCDFYTWERVLYRLRLILDQKISGQDTFDGFRYFSPDGSGKKTKVGLKFTKDQRDRLLSVLPSINL